MEEVEVSAKSVDEAVRLALERLGVSPEEAEITVLSEGRPGLMGIGAEEARVRVRLLISSEQQEAEVLDTAQEVLEHLLDLLQIPAQVHRRTPTEAEEGRGIALDIRGSDLGILIGRRGETLSSLQFMVNLITGRRLRLRSAVPVDVESYRLRREETLRGLALRMAERVRATGQTITLEPMPPHERRIVHLALVGHQDILTQSLGEGESRKVVIALKRP